MIECIEAKQNMDDTCDFIIKFHMSGEEVEIIRKGQGLKYSFVESIFKELAYKLKEVK